MRLSQLVGHGGEGGACDEQLAGHGGKIGACDDTKPAGWSRWVRVMRMSQLTGHGG